MKPVPSKASALLDSSTWQVIKEQADVLVKSGLLPPGIKSGPQAIAIALKGQELGIPIMQSYAHINIIQGKPTVSAELMLSLIYKNCPGAVVNFTRMDDKCCMIESQRPGGKIHSFKFDESDAKSAGLLGRGSWKSYPRAMYRSRCISEMARSMFPDAIMGCSYTPEEVDPEADVDFSSAEPTISSNKLYKAKDLTNKKSFDKNRPAHLKKINKMLTEKGIDNNLWDEIIEKMQGKSSSNLEDVCAEVVGNHFKESLDDDFEIPFEPTPKKEDKSVDAEVVDV